MSFAIFTGALRYEADIYAAPLCARAFPFDPIVTDDDVPTRNPRRMVCSSSSSTIPRSASGISATRWTMRAAPRRPACPSSAYRRKHNPRHAEISWTCCKQDGAFTVIDDINELNGCVIKHERSLLDRNTKETQISGSLALKAPALTRFPPASAFSITCWSCSRKHGAFDLKIGQRRSGRGSTSHGGRRRHRPGRSILESAGRPPRHQSRRLFRADHG